MDNEITRLFCLHIMCPHFLYDGTGGVLIRVIQNLPRALTLKHQFTVVVQKNQRITFREWEKYFLGRKENILFLSLVCGAASAHRTSEKGKVLKAFPLNAASARSVLRRSRKSSRIIPRKSRGGSNPRLPTIFSGAPPCTKSTVFFWITQKAAVSPLPAAAKNRRGRKRNPMRLYSRRFPATRRTKH